MIHPERHLETRPIGSIDIPVVGMGTSGTFEVEDTEIADRVRTLRNDQVDTVQRVRQERKVILDRTERVKAGRRARANAAPVG
jgi:hypothetical protein